MDQLDLSHLGQIDSPKVITTENPVNERLNHLKLGSTNTLPLDLMRDSTHTQVDPPPEVDLHLQSIIII